MKYTDEMRPSEIKSDEIWTIYKLINELPEPYVFYAPNSVDEKLFRVNYINIGKDNPIYEVLPSDVEYISCIYEWVRLELSHIDNGETKTHKVCIKANVMSSEKLSVEQLLKTNHIRIPGAEEIKDARMDNGIPLFIHPVALGQSWLVVQAMDVSRMFEKYLNSFHIPFRDDRDNGARRLTFVFTSAYDAPGRFVEGCVWFYKNAAEVRTYYNELGSALVRESKCRDDLIKLINFINARVFMAQSDGGNNRYARQILYTPRMYLTEDDGFDITITTMINYTLLREVEYQTFDYITAYCPELLNMLAIPIFGLLNGEMTLTEARSHIEKSILARKGQ